MGTLLNELLDGTMNFDEIMNECERDIFFNGPIGADTLEKLAYIKEYYPEIFKPWEEKILNIMGLFYKDISPDFDDLEGLIFSLYNKTINANVNNIKFTPVQNSIRAKIDSNKVYSFSAPTGIGKSYVFTSLITKATGDIVIIVPSRALINEYLIKLDTLNLAKNVSVLPFVDIINKKNTSRRIFVLTPERARMLFKFKSDIQLELVLVDEAQLINDAGFRSVLYDSVIRRINKFFLKAKIVFAHPFVANPEAQISRNKLDLNQKSSSTLYKEKSVGQMFLAYDENNDEFFHFGINIKVFGNRRVKTIQDPIKRKLLNGSTLLVYTSKAKIYRHEYLQSKWFKEYIDSINVPYNKVAPYVEKLEKIIGGDVEESKLEYSATLSLLKQGVAMHHGSLPLNARVVIEEFIKSGYCKICFCTSTLAQGINMPFDIVWIDKWEGEALLLKNIIGRAGRPTINDEFDYGLVVLGKLSHIPKMRKLITVEPTLNSTSLLDIDQEDQSLDTEFTEFISAIITDDFNDDFSLPNSVIERFSGIELDQLLERILMILFPVDSKTIISPIQYKEMTKARREELKECFRSLYENYLLRKLTKTEKSVLSTAIQIFIWKIGGKTFREIVRYRYRYILSKDETGSMKLRFTHKVVNFPDKEAKNLIPLFHIENGIDAFSYDQLIFDTYDYLDKIIDFKLLDVFWAQFMKYAERNKITEPVYFEKAITFCNLIKYGRFEEKEILLLRYGISSDNIEQVIKCVEEISDEELILDREKVMELEEEVIKEVKRYL
ncbi:DEAD/DEAH box helicase [Culicoidibacter larvae]|uniref:DEAD/DEAH box helicase n=1 Tax=Culicoidibacter larvae TaxID=2579976 RepID=A0A5R8QJG2_9FIRM|nr:DEAD/DEAH box helicase [Culicoidibacter larvae]TLG77397.1 DEAD/DEAH box helicase [Culicoidibacter larvae]